MKSLQQTSLDQYQWHWQEAGKDSWTKCQRFPTNIHHELRVNDLIPDEGIGLNERKIQWVHDKDWKFKTKFPSPSGFQDFGQVELAFDGLDTIAKVALNGKTILECDNMFVPQRVDVKKHLVTSGENELDIYFDSAARVGKEREEKYGQKWQNIRESSRMYVRKNQSHWGWDWGPSMITCGPWKDIRLEMFDTRISDLHVDVKLSEDCKSAHISVEVEVEHPQKGAVVACNINPPGIKQTEKELRLELSDDKVVYVAELDLDNPELWWPAGHGKQPLYEASAALIYESQRLQIQTTSFGIRRVELVQRPLKSDDGETFFFRINNRSVFCVGTNWIPCHSLPALITPELYEKNLSYAVENNNNMIRIWGGGLYEGDAFYDYCDKHGLMVWHDMMFACGIYPTDDWFHKSCTEELEAQIRRLRNHPSITLWNGDNEVFFMFDRQNVPYDASVESNWDIYPQRKLYFETIPNVIKKLTPSIPYWPSSPYGGKDANDPKQGDIHQWNVWHNLGLHYQQYPELGGRFVSEYGMHGFPDIRTVKHYCPDPELRYPNSKIMDTHNKSSGAETKMPKYLGANFRIPWYDMESTIYLSQLLQSEALTYANRAWRRGWKGNGKEECSGILIWQLNDIYPTTTWALVDSFWRKKPAFYTTKRDFSPIMLGISRSPVWHFVDENRRHEHPTDIPTFQVYASNLLQEEQKVELRLRMYDWSTHKAIELEDNVRKQTFTLASNQSTELLTVKSPKEVTERSYIILAATLHDAQTGNELSRHFSWPEPFRYLLPAYDAKVDVEVKDSSVKLTAGWIPLKGLLAYIDSEDGEEADWADNMHDLMPGESIELPVKGIDGRQVRTRWLHSWEKKGAFT